MLQTDGLNTVHSDADASELIQPAVAVQCSNEQAVTMAPVCLLRCISLGRGCMLCVCTVLLVTKQIKLHS
jgi:hypothetical protein